jgi:1-deoxy-D-xylulose 5-phosphate reductoisomerase
MIQEKTVNPASALKYSAQRSLGTRDYCPKAPAEEKTDAYKLFSIAAMEKDERFSNQLQEAKAKAKKMSKGEANRQFIRAMNGKAEHVYRGELPFPAMAGQAKREVLAIVGQVMYLYTVNWERG